MKVTLIKIETLNEINLEFFKKLAKNVNSSRFQFKPIRRIYIPKIKMVPALFEYTQSKG